MTDCPEAAAGRVLSEKNSSIPPESTRLRKIEEKTSANSAPIAHVNAFQEK
jgi:hypothetical protein